MNLEAVCASLRSAAGALAAENAEKKNAALLSAAAELEAESAEILEANAGDVQRARESGMRESLVARLALSASGLKEIAASVRALAAQTDPIGEVTGGWTLPNGLEIRRVRVPLGVVAVIYESRPNVTADVFALAYKSANAVLLRGSSSALASNRAIVAALKRGLKKAGGHPDAVELSEPEAGSHADVDWILGATGKIDAALPRGGAQLIRRVVESARIPVIETGAGVCHVYADVSADLQKAVPVIENAKIQKPGACNALECLLVHDGIADKLLPALLPAFARYADKTGRPGGVELRCCPRSLAVLQACCGQDGLPPNVVPASAADWGCEFLDYILAVKTVSSAEEAISHINRFGTRHSESVLTGSRETARRFQREVDAACVYVNASTRFTDGGQFGMGAELGISTQKLHARGPMGVEALTSIKYLIDGDGQIRP